LENRRREENLGGKNGKIERSGVGDGKKRGEQGATPVWGIQRGGKKRRKRKSKDLKKGIAQGIKNKKKKSTAGMFGPQKHCGGGN